MMIVIDCYGQAKQKNTVYIRQKKFVVSTMCQGTKHYAYAYLFHFKNQKN
jgi:hypothetical protein